MESIKIEKLNKTSLEKMGIYEWPIWEKETSEFEWFYDDKEQFYLLEGEVTIKTPEGNFEVGPGDFVTCAKGLNCSWQVKQPVRKHYQFLQ
jgi:uncharacterized cupin superfamily protein